MGQGQNSEGLCPPQLLLQGPPGPVRPVPGVPAWSQVGTPIPGSHHPWTLNQDPQAFGEDVALGQLPGAARPPGPPKAGLRPFRTPRMLCPVFLHPLTLLPGHPPSWAPPSSPSPEVPSGPCSPVTYPDPGAQPDPPLSSHQLPDLLPGCPAKPCNGTHPTRGSASPPDPSAFPDSETDPACPGAEANLRVLPPLPPLPENTASFGGRPFPSRSHPNLSASGPQPFPASAFWSPCLRCSQRPEGR